MAPMEIIGRPRIERFKTSGYLHRLRTDLHGKAYSGTEVFLYIVSLHAVFHSRIQKVENVVDLS